jgi:hypothetical protein
LSKKSWSILYPEKVPLENHQKIKGNYFSITSFFKEVKKIKKTDINISACFKAPDWDL